MHCENFTKNRSRYQWIRFDGVSDVIDAMRPLWSRPEWISHATNDVYCRLLGNPGWIGRHFASIPDVESASLSVWSEGVSMLEGMLSELENSSLPRPMSRRRRSAWSEDDGDEIDRDRLHAGQPYWRTSRRQVTHGIATVSLMSNFDAPGGFDEAAIMWRGAAMVCLARMLETAGYRVELTIGMESTNPFTNTAEHCLMTICLKRSDEPLDLATLAGAISPWFFRAVLLMAQEVGGNTCTAGAGGCGTIAKFKDEIAGGIPAIVVGSVWNRDAAVAWVRQQLESMADTLRPADATV